MKQPLKVAILIDSLSQPAWVASILEDIEQSSVARVTLILRNASTALEGGGLLRRIVRNRSRLAYILFARLDRKLRMGSPDAFAPTDISPHVKAADLVDVLPRKTRFSDYLSHDVKDLMQEAGIDVGLRLTTLDYRECNVSSIEPTWRNNLTGVHTINHSHHLTILDAKERRFKFRWRAPRRSQM